MVIFEKEILVDVCNDSSGMPRALKPIFQAPHPLHCYRYTATATTTVTAPLFQSLVIAYVNQNLHFKYDHILCDDGSRPLVEVVDVSTILNGSGNSNRNQCDYRCRIRPLPPPVKFVKSDLPYGLCVDVHHMEVWWEGVIFDNQNGSDKRRIFFPDLGDEITVGMDVLRITQDWDEVAGNWQCRGSWLFLEVIHDLEQVCPLFVSVKQIWYDMRAMTSFGKIGEWTSNVKASWKELVLEVIGDNLNFFAEEVFKQGLWLAEPACDFNLTLEADLANPYAVMHSENPSNSEMIIDHDTNVKNLVDCCFSSVYKTDKNRGLVSGLLHADSKFIGTLPYQNKFNSVGLISPVRNDSSSINDSKSKDVYREVAGQVGNKKLSSEKLSSGT